MILGERANIVQHYVSIFEQFMYTSEQKYFCSLIINIEKNFITQGL